MKRITEKQKRIRTGKKVADFFFYAGLLFWIYHLEPLQALGAYAVLIGYYGRHDLEELE